MTNPLSIISVRAAGVHGRAVRAVERHGLGGVARIAARRVSPRPARRLEYVIYGLDLRREDAPHPPLETGLTLRQGGLSDVPDLARMEAHLAVSLITRPLARSRIRSGHVPWMVLDRGQGLFQCWILRDHLPLRGAQRDRLELADGVLGLEDSIAAAAARGRGIAPAAWAGIADHLRERDARWLVTKVDITNTPTRKAIVKAGFEEVARIRITRRDWLCFIRVALPARHEAGFGWVRAAERN